MKAKKGKRVLTILLAICMIATTVTPVVFAAAYTDTAGHWGEAAIDYWSDYGIVEGMPDGSFRPDDNMLRAEASAVYSRLLKLSKTADISGYTDVEPGSWYAETMAQCAAKGIINGVSATEMDPSGYLTREQMFTMFARAMKIGPESSAKKIYADAGDTSAYAEGYINALINHDYINGEGGDIMAPLQNITRAEVMQLLRNTISVYATAPGTITPVGNGIALIVSDGVTISGGYSGRVVVSAEGATVDLSGCTGTPQITATENNVSIKDAPNGTSITSAGAEGVNANGKEVPKDGTIIIEGEALPTLVPTAAPTATTRPYFGGGGGGGGWRPNTTPAPTATAEPSEEPTAEPTEEPSEEPTIEPTEAPATEAPSTEAPATDAPATEAPSTDAPATEAPATDAPATEAPATEAPTTVAPSTDAPSTGAPATEAPATDAPATVAPATDAPSTDAPSTTAPATETPSTEPAATATASAEPTATASAEPEASASAEPEASASAEPEASASAEPSMSPEPADVDEMIDSGVDAVNDHFKEPTAPGAKPNYAKLDKLTEDNEVKVHIFDGDMPVSLVYNDIIGTLLEQLTSDENLAELRDKDTLISGSAKLDLSKDTTDREIVAFVKGGKWSDGFSVSGSTKLSELKDKTFTVSIFDKNGYETVYTISFADDTVKVDEIIDAGVTAVNDHFANPTVPGVKKNYAKLGDVTENGEVPVEIYDGDMPVSLVYSDIIGTLLEQLTSEENLAQLRENDTLISGDAKLSLRKDMPATEIVAFVKGGKWSDGFSVSGSTTLSELDGKTFTVSIFDKNGYETVYTITFTNKTVDVDKDIMEPGKNEVNQNMNDPTYGKYAELTITPSADGSSDDVTVSMFAGDVSVTNVYTDIINTLFTKIAEAKDEVLSINSGNKSIDVKNWPEAETQRIQLIKDFVRGGDWGDNEFGPTISGSTLIKALKDKTFKVTVVDKNGCEHVYNVKFTLNEVNVDTPMSQGVTNVNSVLSSKGNYAQLSPIEDGKTTVTINDGAKKVADVYGDIIQTIINALNNENIDSVVSKDEQYAIKVQNGTLSGVANFVTHGDWKYEQGGAEVPYESFLKDLAQKDIKDLDGMYFTASVIDKNGAKHTYEIHFKNNPQGVNLDEIMQEVTNQAETLATNELDGKFADISAADEARTINVSILKKDAKVNDIADAIASAIAANAKINATDVKTIKSGDQTLDLTGEEWTAAQETPAKAALVKNLILKGDLMTAAANLAETVDISNYDLEKLIGKSMTISITDKNDCTRVYTYKFTASPDLIDVDALMTNSLTVVNQYTGGVKSNYVVAADSIGENNELIISIHSAEKTVSEVSQDVLGSIITNLKDSMKSKTDGNDMVVSSNNVNLSLSAWNHSFSDEDYDQAQQGQLLSFMQNGKWDTAIDSGISGETTLDKLYGHKLEIKVTDANTTIHTYALSFIKSIVELQADTESFITTLKESFENEEDVNLKNVITAEKNAENGNTVDIKVQGKEPSLSVAGDKIAAEFKSAFQGDAENIKAIETDSGITLDPAKLSDNAAVEAFIESAMEAAANGVLFDNAKLGDICGKTITITLTDIYGCKNTVTLSFVDSAAPADIVTKDTVAETVKNALFDESGSKPKEDMDYVNVSYSDKNNTDTVLIKAQADNSKTAEQLYTDVISPLLKNLYDSFKGADVDYIPSNVAAISLAETKAVIDFTGIESWQDYTFDNFIQDLAKSGITITKATKLDDLVSSVNLQFTAAYNDKNGVRHTVDVDVTVKSADEKPTARPTCDPNESQDYAIGAKSTYAKNLITNSGGLDISQIDIYPNVQDNANKNNNYIYNTWKEAGFEHNSAAVWQSDSSYGTDKTRKSILEMDFTNVLDGEPIYAVFDYLLVAQGSKNTDGFLYMKAKNKALVNSSTGAVTKNVYLPEFIESSTISFSPYKNESAVASANWKTAVVEMNTQYPVLQLTLQRNKNGDANALTHGYISDVKLYRELPSDYKTHIHYEYEPDTISSSITASYSTNAGTTHEAAAGLTDFDVPYGSKLTIQNIEKTENVNYEGLDIIDPDGYIVKSVDGSKNSIFDTTISKIGTYTVKIKAKKTVIPPKTINVYMRSDAGKSWNALTVNGAEAPYNVSEHTGSQFNNTFNTPDKEWRVELTDETGAEYDSVVVTDNGKEVSLTDDENGKRAYTLKPGNDEHVIELRFHKDGYVDSVKTVIIWPAMDWNEAFGLDSATFETSFWNCAYAQKEYGSGLLTFECEQDYAELPYPFKKYWKDSSLSFMYNPDITYEDSPAVFTSYTGKNYLSDLSSSIGFTAKASGTLAFDYMITGDEDADYQFTVNSDGLDLEKYPNPDGNGEPEWIHFEKEFSLEPGYTQSISLSFTNKTEGKSSYVAIANLQYLTQKADVTVAKDGDGEGTYSQLEEGKQYYVNSRINLSAEPAEGSVFAGWYVNGKLESEFTNYTHVVTAENEQIYAKFLIQGEKRVQVGDQLFDDLPAALEYAETNASEGSPLTVRIIVSEMTVVEDVKVPAHTTLIVPCRKSDSGYEQNGFNPNGTELNGTIGQGTGSTQFSALTINPGATMTIEGTVLVNAVTGRPSAGHYDMDVNGGYATLHLGGNIDVKSGGVLDVCGYLDGEGTVTAESGGEVRDLYIVRNWRGGSQAKEMVLADPPIYPMNEVDMHNITAKTIINSGASLVGTVKMYALRSYYYTRFPQIDLENGLIRNTGGTVVKTFENNREKFVMSGGGKITSSILNIIGMNLSTGEFIYPIDGDMDLVFDGGDWSVEESFKLMPGLSVLLKDGTNMTIEAETARYPKPLEFAVYDSFHNADPANTGGSQYPANRGPAVVELESGASLNILGAFGGNITADEGSTVTTGANATMGVTTWEANGYYSGNPNTTRSLEFPATINNQPMEVGQTYNN